MCWPTFTSGSLANQEAVAQMRAGHHFESRQERMSANQGERVSLKFLLNTISAYSGKRRTSFSRHYCHCRNQRSWRTRCWPRPGPARIKLWGSCATAARWRRWSRPRATTSWWRWWSPWPGSRSGPSGSAPASGSDRRPNSPWSRAGAPQPGCRLGGCKWGHSCYLFFFLLFFLHSQTDHSWAAVR